MTGISSFLTSNKNRTALLGIISLFLAIPVRILFPELTESFFGLLILGLVLLLLCLIGAREKLKAFLFSKQARYGLNTMIMILLFLAVIILVNSLGLLKHQRFDLTASGHFTLTPQTIRVIQEFKEPVKILCFFPEEPAFEMAKTKTKDLLEAYRFYNKNFIFSFVDPETKPALAGQYRVKQQGTILFISGSREKAVLEPTEQIFTSALLEVAGIQAKKVYFLSGNGEREPDNNNPEGYREARTGLIRDLYQVEVLDLNRTPKIPQDCAVLIIAGTQKPISAEAKKAILTYAMHQGKIFLLTDPNPPAEIKEILSEWGLGVNEGRIIDQGSYVAPDIATPAIFKGQYPKVVITTGLDTTYFPDVLSFDLSGELTQLLEIAKEEGQTKVGWPLRAIQYRNLAILPALLTSQASWMEKGGNAAGEIEKKQGPLALGAIIIAGGPAGSEGNPPFEKNKNLTKMVVLGDSDFASNIHFKNGGNGDLFLNAVNWLAEEEHLISIRPKPYSFRRLLANENELRFIRYSSLVFLPLLLLIIGGILWWKKR